MNFGIFILSRHFLTSKQLPLLINPFPILLTTLLFEMGVHSIKSREGMSNIWPAGPIWPMDLCSDHSGLPSHSSTRGKILEALAGILPAVLLGLSVPLLLQKQWLPLWEDQLLWSGAATSGGESAHTNIVSPCTFIHSSLASYFNFVLFYHLARGTLCLSSYSFIWPLKINSVKHYICSLYHIF